MDFKDKNDVPFADHHRHLPKLASDFPKSGVVTNPGLRWEYKPKYKKCAVCDWSYEEPGFLCRIIWLELHHIIGGQKGRSDELTNYIVICSACHEKVNTSELPMGKILYHKWKADQGNVDWARLAILRGCFLPDLETGDA